MKKNDVKNEMKNDANRFKKDLSLKELESLYGMFIGPYDVAFIESPEEFSRLLKEFDERYFYTGMKRMDFIWDNLLEGGDSVDYDGLLGSLRKFDELHGWYNVDGGYPIFKYRLVLDDAEYISSCKDKKNADIPVCEWLESSLRYVGKNLSDGSKIYGFILENEGSVNCMFWDGFGKMFHILDIKDEGVQDLLYNECGVKKIEFDDEE